MGANETNRNETSLNNQGNRTRTREIAATNAAKHLLELLEYDPQSIGRDTTTCFHQTQLLDEQAETRAAAMIRNKKFKTYSEVNCSTFLLVNGHIDLAAAEGSSPFSFMVAKLARNSEKPGSAFVVKYFCDQHRPNIDVSSLSPGLRMMVSLNGQLVTQMIERGIEVDLSFLTQVGWQQVAKKKLSILCIIFRELKNQLPTNGVLLCLLDEVSQYETALYERDTDVVLRKLTRLVGMQDKLIFKLLVTCQGRALGISKYFVDHTLDLDESVEVDDLLSW